MAGSTNGKNYVNQPSIPKISIGIKSQDGDLGCFKIPADKKIQGVLRTYCQGKNFKFREMVFLHNGSRIKTSMTPIEIGIEDGDELDAMKHHDGGGNLKSFP